MSNPKMRQLGLLVKQARSVLSDNEGKKITQAELADRLDISRSYLADIEVGRIEPSYTILSKLATVAGLSLDFFNVADGPAAGRGMIPVLGSIRAGEPIEAVESMVGFVSIPLRGNLEEYFGLLVLGDSMDQCGIHDGDIAIIRQQAQVENGEIAAVIIDEEKATIKKFYWNGSYISLSPASSNPEHQPRIIDPNVTPVRILGRVVKAVINV